MRVAFAVLVLFVAYAASYPSSRDSNDEESNSELELEVRSILDQLSEEKMTRSLTEDADEEEESFSKRQGGHNVVNKGTKCEIECVHSERFPKVGRGKTIAQAAKVCKNRCVVPNSKRGGKKVHIKNPKRVQKLNTRAFFDEDDESVSSEQQDVDRRELYDYLVEQLQQNNDE